MDLRAAEDYLLGLELFGMRFGLERMHRLTTALGMPQRRFASIHVVGSNGKTSSTRMIAAILEAHGLRTGSYTSPHLQSYRERIEVGGAAIGETDFAAAVERVKNTAELVNRTLGDDEQVTQFEALTAAAYYELARQGVEVAVVEAGLGGRYDATNVIPSKVQVLTGIELEHTRWLGPTRAAIAEEKLAVVRDHGCLVAPELSPEVEAVAARAAGEHHARRVTAPDELPAGEARALAVHGAYQRRNFALARAAAEAFLERPLDAEAVERAAGSLALAGRMEVVGETPLTIHDGAHNPAGAAALARSLPEVIGERPLTAVVAVLEDKDAAGILAELLPLCARVIFTSCANPRALPPATLETLAAKVPAGDRGRAPAVELVPDPRAAVERARALAGPGGAVLVTGSIYLIADLVAEPGAARSIV